MTQSSVLLCAALATAALGSGFRPMPRLLAHGQDVTALTADRVVERALNRGEEHRYDVALAEGEHVSVIVDQQAIDVTVQVSRPDGAALAGFQDETATGHEVRAELVADSEGRYTFAIKGSPGRSATGSYAIRLASRRLATDDDRSMQDVHAARAAARQHQAANRLADARSLLERALAIAERVRGPGNLDVAAVAAELAEVHLLVPDRAKSELLFRRALAIREKTLGAGHPSAAFLRARLAILYQQAGQVAKAEELLQPALALLETALGPEHPWVVRCLVTLGNLRVTGGDLDEAERIDRRALAILDATGENDSGAYLGLLNNLAVIYRQKKDYARAEELFRRALAMSERQRGSESTDVARILSNLALVANGRRDYASALEYYRRALSIYERISGPDHPDLATILNNLAVVHHATGDIARSLDAHFRALRIREQTVGEHHPGTLQSVGNIALVYWLAGDAARAVAFQRRADAIVEAQLALNLAVGSERQKQALLRSTSQRTDRTISLHLNEAAGDPDASALAALVLLQRKGRVLDAMTRTFEAVRRRIAAATDKTLLDELNATTAQLARLVLNAPEEIRPPEYRQSIAQLEARKERLESALSAHDAEFRAGTQPVTLEAVQAAVPRDAALLEYAVFRPFDPRAEGDGMYGPAHYAAYAIRSAGRPHGVDLGPAGPIDDAVGTLREALRDPKRRDVMARARRVHELVMQPLQAHLGDATRLLISPDGILNLVPFESLVDEQGVYILRRYATSYVTSGRDLLRMRVKRGNGNPAVVIADPWFGEPRATLAAVSGTAPQAARADAPGETAGHLPAIYFPPLPASAAEGRAIKKLFPDAYVLMGKGATKAALVRTEPPRMLHVASHGFFVNDTPDNPLLRSGLAFAGANLTGGARDDGILTALEASGLNLWGTKLVTLSACDTGLGEVRNGEGVYGLRRAFVLAGAETLVMSLWPITDSVAGETMVRYYEGLRAGAGRGDALRKAKLAILDRPGRQHPYYWASFIQSGEWANLAGRR